MQSTWQLPTELHSATKAAKARTPGSGAQHMALAKTGDAFNPLHRHRGWKSARRRRLHKAAQALLVA
jgi:hypothetical protein